jgi:hypothetical protein
MARPGGVVSVAAHALLAVSVAVHAAMVGSLARLPPIIFEPGLGGAICWRIPSLVPLSATTLLAFAGSRCTNGDGCQPAGYNGTVAKRVMVGLRRSFDGGATWQPLQVVWSGACDCNVNGGAVTGTDATAVYDATSSTVFTLFPTLPGRKSFLVYASKDGGATWAQRGRPIPIPAPLAASSGDHAGQRPRDVGRPHRLPGAGPQLAHLLRLLHSDLRRRR